VSRTVLLVVPTLALVGCTNITGLGGGSGYSCKAPEGVACDSMSGVYANSLADRLPGRRAVVPSVGAAPASAPHMPRPTPPVGTTSSAPSSLRSAARVLRLWVKPWEDADGDLIDQSYVYVQIDNGQWLIDHAQRQIREAYAPVKAPPRLLTSGTPQGAGHGPQRPPAQAVPSGPAPPRPPASSDPEE
jgi:conjugal transfer pilus assembly protein TraV